MKPSNLPKWKEKLEEKTFSLNEYCNVPFVQKVISGACRKFQ
jgi:hypothetical protein